MKILSYLRRKNLMNDWTWQLLKSGQDEISEMISFFVIQNLPVDLYGRRKNLQLSCNNGAGILQLASVWSWRINEKV